MAPELSVRLAGRLPSTFTPPWKRAAQIQGTTLTDFVVGAAHEAALAIEESELIRISTEDQKRFAEALIDPPKPNAAVLRAFEHHCRLVGGE